MRKPLVVMSVVLVALVVAVPVPEAAASGKSLVAAVPVPEAAASGKSLVAAVAVPEAAASGKSTGTPAGTWMMKTDFEFIIDPGPPPVTVPFELGALQDFDADGRTTLLLPFGPGHPNETDTRVGCMGEWAPRRGEGRTYDLTMRCNYNQDPDGSYGLIRGIMRMIDKDTIEYEFSYVDYEADGTLIYDQGWGVSNGTRIKIDPLP